MAVKAPKKPPVDPYLATAKAAVAASIDPARADIQKAIATAEANRALAAHGSESIINAVAQMGKGDAEQVRAGYAAAGDRVAAYGGAFTGALRDDASNAAKAANVLIGKLGAPGTVTSRGDDAANVTYLTSGATPAAGLAGQGAAALAQTLAHRLATGTKLGDAALAGDWKAQTDIKSLGDQILSLESKRPGLIMQALDSLHTQANAKRATDTQVGYLQLQQAKTVQDQAVAMTNLTGTLHIVVKGKVIDTGKSAGGSDAAVVQQRAAQAAADNATRSKIADASNQTRLQVAQTAADAKREAATTAAAAAKARAEISRQAAQNKPATAAQKATVIKAANAAGNSVVSSKIAVWYANTPNLAPQQKGEKLDDYIKRHAQGVKELNNKKAYNWDSLLATVSSTITPQLQILGWTPEQIKTQARTLLKAQINVPPGK